MYHEIHSAKFVSITPDAEKSIVYMARVSNPNNQNNQDTAPNLIRYLVKHKHWSPFEMATLQVEIETTRAIAAQILRHKTFSFQEFSQRYSDPKNLPAIGLPNLRRQDLKNKQASHDDVRSDVLMRFEPKIQALYETSQALYDEMIEHGIAKESARSILPLGTPTKMYMSGSIRSWIFYCQVRCGIETQLEHRLIADSCKLILKDHLPTVYMAVFPEG